MYNFKNFNVLILSLLMTVNFFSCDESTFGDPVIISNVEKDFYFDIWEELRVGDRFVHFTVETIENGDCLNGTVDYDFVGLTNKLTLTIKDVIIPDDCIPGIAPSVANVYVGTLPRTDYTFELSLQNTVINKGHLSISDKKYNISLETEEGVIVLHNTLYRVPDNTFWGYIAYENSVDESAAANLFADLEHIGEQVALTKGYYGYFDINTSANGIEIKDSPLSTYVKPFLFSYDGNWNAIKNIVETFSAEYPGISLKLFADKGQVFYF